MKESELIQSKKKSLRIGIILIATTCLPVIGIIFKLFSLIPEHKEDFSDKVIRFAYHLSPDNSSFADLVDIIIYKEAGGASLLTLSNILSIIIIFLFVFGCFSISSWSAKSDRLTKLRREANDEQIKNDIKGSLA